MRMVKESGMEFRLVLLHQIILALYSAQCLFSSKDLKSHVISLFM